MHRTKWRSVGDAQSSLHYSHPEKIQLMKTTVEISDALFKSARQLAKRNQTTMTALIEDGLRRVLNDQQTKNNAMFKLKDASVQGKVMLISHPQRWQQMEEEHIISRVIKNLN
jgi:predicted transcriptional regulator